MYAVGKLLGMKSKPARVNMAGEVTWQVMAEATLKSWRGYEQELGKADSPSVQCSCIQQMLTKLLLCARHWSRHQGWSGDHRKPRSSLWPRADSLHGLTEEAHVIGAEALHGGEEKWLVHSMNAHDPQMP